MLSKEQFLIIAAKQNTANTLLIGPDWKQEPKDWGMAVMSEAVEGADHYGWKWWAKQARNTEQAAMEVIDGIHFAMSGCLQQWIPEQLFDAMIENAAAMSPEHKADLASWTFIDYMKEVGVCAAAGNFPFALYLLIESAALVGLTYDTVFSTYIGKNVLNRFRKTHGYKDGSYIKQWNGAEDNVTLQRIINGMKDVPADAVENVIENSLEAEYKVVLASQNTTQH